MNRIIGLPRSGTRFITSLNNHIGFPSSHEKHRYPSNLGCEVSWKFLVLEDRGIEFEKTLIQIRDPYKVVQSIQTIGGLRRGDDNRAVRQLWSPPKALPLHERATKWYLIAMEKLMSFDYDYLYKVEDLHLRENMEKYLSYSNLEITDTLVNKALDFIKSNNTINTRSYPEFDLSKCDEYEKIKEYRKQFGYE